MLFPVRFLAPKVNRLPLAATLYCLALGLFATPATIAQTPAPSVPSVSYATLPLAFEPNQGQAAPDVSFLARGDSYSLLIGNAETMLSLRNPSSCKSANLRDHEAIAHCTPTWDQLHMQLLGANPNMRSTQSRDTTLPSQGKQTQVTGQNLLPGRVNYLVGNDPSKWRTGIPTYSKVQLAGVYPGIDLIYYGNQRHLEYDFVVAPGADPQTIRLRFAGANLHLDQQRNLELNLKDGKIVFDHPILYQQTDHGRQEVSGSFRLLADNSLAFHVGRYDHARPLVIDPTLAYSTYINGAVVSAIAIDSSGGAYVTGTATAITTTPGVFQGTSKAGVFGGNAFVTKLNSIGTAAIYSTYLGGSGANPSVGSPPPAGAGDGGAGIAVDANGDAYITGFTYSPDFPVKNPIQAANNGAGPGADNAFVTELSPDGSALVYSTFLGGGGCSNGNGDQANGIAVDSSNATYIVGTTCSSDFPTTTGAAQPAVIGDTMGFAAKIAPAGASLVYATYIGGSRETLGNGIAIDTTGSAYVAGTTYSPDFPVTPGAFQSSIATPFGTSGYVAKLNPAGSAYVYATYLGGTGGTYTDPQGNSVQLGDTSNAIAVDSTGSAYVTGTAFSHDFPVTAGVFQPASAVPNGFSNAFVTKFSADGKTLAYSTYLGGSGPPDIQTASQFVSLGENGNAITVGQDGIAFVAGATPSIDFPVTLDAYQAVNHDAGNNNTNAFITGISSLGTGLSYSTYLGGSQPKNSNQADYATGIAWEPVGKNLYIAGITNSSDFPVTPGAYESKLTGTSGWGWAASFPFGEAPIQPLAIAPASLTLLSPGLNQPSAVKTITLLNVSSEAVAFTGIAVPDNTGFAETNNCPAKLQPNDACTISVTYTPSAAATRQTYLVFTYIGEIDAPQEIPLTGGEIVYPPNATFNPTNLTFADQIEGTTSAPQTAILTNSGKGPLNITSITLGGGGTSNDNIFAQTNNCGSTVAAGASCTFSITFVPQSPGEDNDGVFVKDNQTNSPQILGLSGTGTLPAITVSTTTLSLQSPALNQASAAQTVTVANSSTAAVAIQSVSLAGTNVAEFSQTNTCGNSIAASSTCTISVIFTPTVAGNQTANLVIASNAPGAMQIIVALTGSEIVYPPNATFSPSSLTFPVQAQGSSSTPLTAVLTNSGKGTLNITAITIGSGTDPNNYDPYFSQTNNCGATLATGASCTFHVTFIASAYGPVYGGVFVQDNQSNSPQILTLSGTEAVPTVTQSVTGLTFAAQAVGSASTAQTVTLTNTSQVPVSIKSVTPTGDFSQTNACNNTIAVSGTCVISVTFKPTATGSRTGAITITDNATGSPQIVTLSGTGITPAPATTFAPSSLTFAAQTLGSTSTAQTITLTNSGTAALTIASIALSGDFAETNACGTTLAPAANCTISVTFTPTNSGTRTGAITVTDDATGSPQTVALTGTGTSVDLTPSLASLSISSVEGTANDPITISSLSGFSGTVSLACTVTYQGTGTPADPPTCALNPAQGDVAANGSFTAKLTVSTIGSHAIPSGPIADTTTATPLHFKARNVAQIFAALLIVGFLPRRRWRKLFLVALAVVFVGSSGGCGGSSTPHATTGTYQVTVTATSASLTATTVIGLTVN